MTAMISNSEISNVSLPHKDWSSLPLDIIRCFILQISLKDLYAFGGVCKSWRSEANNAKSNNTALRISHYKIPILLVPKEIQAPFSDVYNLAEGQISQLDLLETKGSRCFSSQGWLLLATECKDEDNKLSLLNPLTSVRIELPSLPREMFDLSFLAKFVLSSSPSRTSDYGVMILSYNDLLFHKPGYNNDTWTRIHVPSTIALVDGVYHNGHFYVVDFFAKVFICEIEDSNDLPLKLKLVVADSHSPIYQPDGRVFPASYLVEVEGILLLILTLLDDDDDDLVTEYIVINVPIYTGKSWETSQAVKTLGNKTLFVGANTSSFWIQPPDDSMCQPNCIYFVNKNVVSEAGDIDFGIYHMNERKVERFQTKLPCSEFQKSHSWLQLKF